MKAFLLSVVIFQAILLVRSEEDVFLANLRHQFADVPRDVKLFDFLQNENNLKGLLGLHNDMCQQLAYYNDLKLNAQKRARRDAGDETSAAPTVPADDAVNATTVDATGTVSDTTTGLSDTTTASSDSSASTTLQRSRRDATDPSASTTNTTASSNPADDKDQQQNLNDQQPPADDQGDQAATGEQQEAEMQAAGAAYFKQLILNVLRYVLNCLMTYINMFY